jgi:lactate dehydrogenase-like 2-hydroxyacid dehydrogenase
MKSLLISIVAAFLPLTALATDAPTPKSAHPMKIGIIGAGEIGGALARHWAAAGHQLLISSRHPNNCRDGEGTRSKCESGHAARSGGFR